MNREETKNCYLLRDTLIEGDYHEAGERVELNNRDFNYFLHNKIAQEKKPKD